VDIARSRLPGGLPVAHRGGHGQVVRAIREGDTGRTVGEVNRDPDGEVNRDPNGGSGRPVGGGSRWRPGFGDMQHSSQFFVTGSAERDYLVEVLHGSGDPGSISSQSPSWYID